MQSAFVGLIWKILCNSPVGAVPVPSKLNHSLERMCGTTTVTEQHWDCSLSPTFLCTFQICLTLLLTSGGDSSLNNKKIHIKFVPGLFCAIFFPCSGRRKVQAVDQCFLFPFPRVHLSSVPLCASYTSCCLPAGAPRQCHATESFCVPKMEADRNLLAEGLWDTIASFLFLGIKPHL